MKNLPQKYERLLRAYSQTLRVPQQTSPQPIVIAPFGPCCVGKTTTITHLAKRLSVVHINHDRIRILMRKRGLEKEEDALYKYLFIVRLAKKYLQRGYSVVLDRDFGTNNKDLLREIEKLTKELGARLFLIQITAPKQFIKKKIFTRKLISPEMGGIPDRHTAWSCYTYSITHYQENYKKLATKAIAKVNTSKPLTSQLKTTILFLKKEMGL